MIGRRSRYNGGVVAWSHFFTHQSDQIPFHVLGVSGEMSYIADDMFDLHDLDDVFASWELYGKVATRLFLHTWRWPVGTCMMNDSFARHLRTAAINRGSTVDDLQSMIYSTAVEMMHRRL